MAYKYRFNWNPPIHMSPHDSKTVYYGGNVVFKTTNRGHSWEVISPDLTTDDKSKQQSSGGPVVTDNTAAEFHCTILTIAESPAKAGVIWVGTDDGNIQVTRDGGKTWTNVVKNIKGLPANSWVACIEASRFDAGTAYVAVDRHREDDFGPHAFKTSDYGQTWTAIKGDLPAKGYVHVVREDPKTRDLLYAGTELGVFASWDGGRRWVSIRNNVPPAAVNDLAIHPRDNDLIIGTHGRGVWILDNITPLQQLAEARAADAHLFDIRPAIRYQIWGKDSNLGQKTFIAQNPPYGAVIDYYLKSDAAAPVTITVADRGGKVIRTIRGASNRAGVNRVAWDLRHDGAIPATGSGSPFGGGAQAGGAARGAQAGGQRGATAAGEGAAEGTGGGRFGFGGGPYATPGDYTVTIRAGGKQLSKPVRVGIDPRVQISEAELAAQLGAALELRSLSSRLNEVVARVDDLTRQLTTLGETLKRGGDGGPPAAGEAMGNGPQSRSGPRDVANGVHSDITAALDELKKLRSTLVREGQFGYRYAPKLREEVNSLLSSISNPIAPPTEPQMLRLREVTEETAKAVGDLNAIINGPIKRVNERLAAQPHIATGAQTEMSPAF